MEGASSSQAGAAGLVPAPKIGEQNKFLRGDGTWAEAGLTEEEKSTLADSASKLGSLIGDSAKEDGSIPSVAEIASDVLAKALIPENAQESLDTLQEIADWIQKHPGDISEINSSISTLQSSVGSLEDIINGANGTEGLVSTVSTLYDAVLAETTGLNDRVTNIEDILYDTTNAEGSPVQGLVSIVQALKNAEGNFVLQSVYQSEVGSISSLNFTNENSTTIVDEINSINSRLRWVDLDEE